MLKNEMKERTAAIAYRHRGWLVAPPLIYGVISTWHEHEQHVVIWVSAAVIFILGMALRIWAQQHIRYRLKVNKTLTTTGPYAFARNPIYIANTCICIALTLASELLWLLPITLLTCALVYALVVQHEEGQLVKCYGNAYLEYKREVSRWFPRLRKGIGFQWSRDYLVASLVSEAYNLLFLVPLILKEVCDRTS